MVFVVIYDACVAPGLYATTRLPRGAGRLDVRWLPRRSTSRA